jgi:hypothetical protein
MLTNLVAGSLAGLVTLGFVEAVAKPLVTRWTQAEMLYWLPKLYDATDRLVPDWWLDSLTPEEIKGKLRENLGIIGAPARLHDQLLVLWDRCFSALALAERMTVL